MTGRKKLSRLPGKKDWLARWQVFLQRFVIIISYPITIDLPEALLLIADLCRRNSALALASISLVKDVLRLFCARPACILACFSATFHQVKAIGAC